MNRIPFRTATCLTVACLAIAATSNIQKRLTPRRLAELTAPDEAPALKGCSVEISALAPANWLGNPDAHSNNKFPVKVSLRGEKMSGVIEVIREFRFPSKFKTAQAGADGSNISAPTTPTAFEKVNTGWTIRLTAQPHGKLIAIQGIADYVEAELVNGGYGPITGPIHTDQGKLISPNVLHQPKVQTTTTRFHLFALPGESYEVTLYRGAKAEKHMVSVTAE